MGRGSFRGFGDALCPGGAVGAVRRGGIRRSRHLEGGAADEDVIISKGYTGKTCRVVRNRFTEEWERSGLTALPMPLQGMWIGRSTHIAARELGIADLGSMPAGQGSGLSCLGVPIGMVLLGGVLTARTRQRAHAP